MLTMVTYSLPMKNKHLKMHLSKMIIKALLEQIDFVFFYLITQKQNKAQICKNSECDRSVLLNIS